jgi:hypothetical protein
MQTSQIIKLGSIQVAVSTQVLTSACFKLFVFVISAFEISLCNVDISVDNCTTTCSHTFVSFCSAILLTHHTVFANNISSHESRNTVMLMDLTGLSAAIPLSTANFMADSLLIRRLFCVCKTVGVS